VLHPSSENNKVALLSRFVSTRKSHLLESSTFVSGKAGAPEVAVQMDDFAAKKEKGRCKRFSAVGQNGWPG
jgi:hypothetical protein